MVRSLKVCLLACILAIAFAMPLQASSIPYQGTISDTYVKIFEDIVSDISINDNYVFYRSNEYEYTMLVGDISESDGVFSMENGEMYVVTQVLLDSGTWNQNSYYHYKRYFNISIELDSNEYLVYSDLKGYPKLEERGVVYAFLSAFLLFTCFCAFIVYRIYKFCLRGGSRGFESEG